MAFRTLSMEEIRLYVNRFYLDLADFLLPYWRERTLTGKSITGNEAINSAIIVVLDSL